MTPWVTHNPIAARDSDQAGSLSGAGGLRDIAAHPGSGRGPGGGRTAARPRGTMAAVMMPQQVPTVSAAEVPADAVVLDVREDDEWAAGHIDGATHIRMGDVPARLDEVPDGDPVYVTCRGGGRSARVAAWLNQNGYDAVNVGGGMGEWEALGRPMVSETGEPPFVR